MREFDYKSICEKLLSAEVLALLTQIHEYKGKQDLFALSDSDILDRLVELARIQSTDASNRIEGIRTTDERLKLIAKGKTLPKTREEQEIAGYRDVLAIIHENFEFIPPKPGMILQLHRDLYKYSGKTFGGSYKTTNNAIEEVDEDGNRRIRFQPVEAWETAEAMDRMCASFEKAAAGAQAEPLLASLAFVLDFLCIHPFSDGNGRISRLLTLLLLYRFGFAVGKFISIEKLIEESKETYYEALQYSSQDWHENANNYAPFVKYMLGVILAAYREYERRVEAFKPAARKPDRVKEVIKEHLGKITKREVLEKCPGVSEVTVQRALNDLVKSGAIIKIGGGRYTEYAWNNGGIKK